MSIAQDTIEAMYGTPMDRELVKFEVASLTGEDRLLYDAMLEEMSQSYEPPRRVASIGPKELAEAEKQMRQAIENGTPLWSDPRDARVYIVTPKPTTLPEWVLPLLMFASVCAVVTAIVTGWGMRG